MTNYIDKINYILNFDENKLFNTKLDDECTNKKAYKERIKKAKVKYKEYLKDRDNLYDTARAFKVCDLYLTNTPHQAIAEYIVKMLSPKSVDIFWFLDYLVSELKKIDNEALNKENKNE